MQKVFAYPNSFRSLLLLLALPFCASDGTAEPVSYKFHSAPSDAHAVTHLEENHSLEQATENATALFTSSPSLNIDSEMGIFSAVIGEQQEPSLSYYYVYGGPFSPNQLINIIISDPSGSFTVSTTGYDGTFTTSLTVSANGDGYLDEPIFVRYMPTAAGNHVATIYHTSSGVEPKPLALEGNATEAAPMPVELASFRVDALNQQAVLSWATASEQDNSHFEIEMATGMSEAFKKVGRVESRNSNSTILTKYSFKYPIGSTTGTMYFRLRQVDLDGSHSYSKIVSLDKPGGATEPGFSVGPNPIKPTTQLSFVASEDGPLRVKVINLGGVEVYSRLHAIEAGENRIDLNLYDKPAGTYILTAEFKGETTRTKLVKD